MSPAHSDSHKFELVVEMKPYQWELNSEELASNSVENMESFQHMGAVMRYSF